MDRSNQNPLFPNFVPNGAPNNGAQINGFSADLLANMQMNMMNWFPNPMMNPFAQQPFVFPQFNFGAQNSGLTSSESPLTATEASGTPQAPSTAVLNPFSFSAESSQATSSELTSSAPELFGNQPTSSTATLNPFNLGYFGATSSEEPPRAPEVSGNFNSLLTSSEIARDAPRTPTLNTTSSQLQMTYTSSTITEALTTVDLPTSSTVAMSTPEPVQQTPIRGNPPGSKEVSPVVNVIDLESPASSKSNRTRSTISLNLSIELENDEGNDDVDDMFGVSFEKEEEQQRRRRSGSGTGEALSPIVFTPPDSPQREMSFDDIFGISTAKEPIASNGSTPVPARTPAAPLTSKPRNATIGDQPIPLYMRQSNVPIYKQKAALVALEGKEAMKRKDPNYDPFAFVPDEEFGGPVVKKQAKENVEPKSRINIEYQSGEGFEVKGKKAMSKKVDPKPIAKEIDMTSLAEEIRKCKDEQMTISFVKIQQIGGTECARDHRVATAEEPLLPRFVIRIDQSPAEANRKRLRKRRSKGSDDEENEEILTSRRSKNMDKVYSLHLQTGPPTPRSVVPARPCAPGTDKSRLNAFGSAEGILPKNAFVIYKTDVLKENCPIWKVVDNMIQKFAQIKDRKTDKLVYESTNTYSGWCDEIASQCFRISVRYVKKTRTDAVVEPEIPLAELFSAASVEFFRHPGTVFVESETPENLTNKAKNLAETDPKRVILKNLLEVCLGQVADKKHVETLVKKKDSTYLCSLKNLKMINKQSKIRIKSHIPIGLKYRQWIGTYTRLAIIETTYHSLTVCQICQVEKSSRILQFFDKTSYDTNLNVDGTIDPDDLEYPFAVDTISCDGCARAIEHLHKMHHIQFHMLRTCQDKLEEMGTRMVESTTEQLLDAVKADEKWMDGVVGGYCEMWERVKKEF